MNYPQPKTIYRHYKGREYTVLNVARNTETKEEMVIYQSNYEPFLIWARPLEMWNEVLDDGTKRFELIEKNDKKIAIVGSRNFANLQMVVDYIKLLPKETTIVSGGAKGVDSIAEKAADKFNLNKKIFLPNWDQYGKSAGYKRNVQIVSYADEVVAFWDGTSNGTQHSINLAKQQNKPVTVYIYKEES